MAFSDFHPIVRQWFTTQVGEPTFAQLRGWDAIARGRHTLIAAPTGSGKTLAAFLTAINTLLEEQPDGAAARRGPRRLRVAAQGTQRRHPQEPGRATRRYSPPRGSDRGACAAHHGGRANRRYDAVRAGRDAADAASHPGHDPGIALPAPHLGPQPPDAAHRTHGDRRRDSRRDRLAPRRAPGADARTARGRGRGPVAANRVVGDPDADRRGRQLPHRRPLRRLRHHRRRPPAGNGPRRRTATLRARGGDVARGLGGVLRPPDDAHRRSQDDPDLREHAPHGGAGGPSPERAARR